MRRPVDAARVREFLRALGAEAREETHLYLTGGATAVLLGWRVTTVDLDITGPWDAPMLRGVASAPSVTAGGARLTAVRAPFAATPRSLRLDGATATLGQSTARLSGTGRWTEPGALDAARWREAVAVDATVEVPAGHAADLASWLPADSPVAGAFSVTARVQGTPASWTARGRVQSTHLTGAAVDISKRGLGEPQVMWLRTVLQRLERRRLVYAAEEFREPHFHVFVRKRYLSYARRLPSPLLVGNELYLVNDVGIASCLDARTGEPHWIQRLGGNYSASPVFADGRIYFLAEEGTATVVAPGTEFRKLATNTLDGETLASMAVSGGSFFIRSATHLYRIGKPPGP